MRACLGLLQNAELFHFSNRSMRSAGPGVRAGKRKARGHKQRGHEQRYGYKIRSPQVEPGAQPVGNERPQKSAGRNCAPHIPHVPQGKQRWQREQEQRKAGEGGSLRIDRVAAEPTPAQNQDRRRQQKRRKPENLEEEIRAIGPRGPDPISRRTAVGRWSAHVERRILRRIRKQRQRDQYRQRDAQKSYQLVEPLISSRSQKAHEISSAFWGRLSVAAGAGASLNPPGGTPKRGRSYQTPAARQQILSKAVSANNTRRRGRISQPAISPIATPNTKPLCPRSSGTQRTGRTRASSPTPKTTPPRRTPR